MQASGSVLVAVDFNENEPHRRSDLVAVGPKFIPRLVAHRVQVVFHAFDDGLKVSEFDGVAVEDILQCNENWVVVVGQGLCFRLLEFQSDVDQRHHATAMFFGGEGGFSSRMKLVDHGLPCFGCFSQGLGFENGGFLIAVDDVVHPTAQGIDGVNRSALVGLERAEGGIEGGGGVPAHCFAKRVGLLKAKLFHGYHSS